MRFFNGAIAISTVLISTVSFVVERAQSQAVTDQRHSGLQPVSDAAPANPAVETCSPAPCVLPPVWPSSSFFTLNAPIAANPRNPKHLLLGSVDSDCSGGSPAFYRSGDGGSSWQHRCMPRIFYKGNEYIPLGEPTVGYDSKGTAYNTGSYQIDDDFSSVGFVAFQKSSDGGNTWSVPVPALGNPNAYITDSKLAIDMNVGSPHTDAVYIAGLLHGPLDNGIRTQVVGSHSSDGGATWIQVPVAPVHAYPAEDAYPRLAVGKDGTIYVAWMFCNTSPFFCEDNKGHILLSKSTDGGNTWSKAKLIFTVNLNSLPNTNHVGIDAPVIGVDSSSGPYAGNVYIAMYGSTGSYLRVGVARSTDGGNTWSKPVPVAPPSETHDQFFPWLSVSPTGLVGVSWMDRRNDPANVDYQAFAAISRDGGQSFGPNVQLTTGFSDPNRGGEGNGWIGDYTGNTWAGPNYFVAAWMDNSNTPGMVDVVGGIRLK